eukprot:1774893-Prymnesium_polylepis.2
MVGAVIDTLALAGFTNDGQPKQPGLLPLSARALSLLVVCVTPANFLMFSHGATMRASPPLDPAALRHDDIGDSHQVASLGARSGHRGGAADDAVARRALRSTSRRPERADHSVGAVDGRCFSRGAGRARGDSVAHARAADVPRVDDVAAAAAAAAAAADRAAGRRPPRCSLRQDNEPDQFDKLPSAEQQRFERRAPPLTPRRAILATAVVMAGTAAAFISASSPSRKEAEDFDIDFLELPPLSPAEAL